MYEEDDDYWFYLQDQYETELIRDGIQEQSIEIIKYYLGTYGDAIYERIERLRSEANSLLSQNFYGPSLMVSVIAMEILIRYLLLKPLLQGAFLSDGWADLLVNRIVQGRSSNDRELLPAVLKQWNYDLTSFKLDSGEPLWSKLLGVWKSRNEFVHKGVSVSQSMANDALGSLNYLTNVFLVSLSKKFRMSWPNSGAWCEIKQGVGAADCTTSYQRKDPFSEKGDSSKTGLT